MNIDISKVTFVPRKQSKTRNDTISYEYDGHLITLDIPIAGHMTFSVKKGTRSNSWPYYNLPPRFRPVAASLLRHYERHHEEHKAENCEKETICYICLCRKYQRGKNAALLDQIIVKKMGSEHVLQPHFGV